MLHSQGLERFRKSREIVGDPSILRAKHVAYLGLFNATTHEESIISWLPKLQMGTIPLLVVDNSSVDDTWNLFRELIGQLHPNSVFVRNAINFGGYGGLAVNLDLLENADWITTFHQDDQYASDHLIVHSQEISLAETNRGIISCEQVSYSPSRERLAVPRAHWFMEPNPDPASLFLANLFHHTLPFSGATIRIEVMREIPIPWHSTAFPDTEIVLRMIPRWNGSITQHATVKYLENPNSESHSIYLEEREFGSFMSLVRIFRSDGFMMLCREIQEDSLDKFASELSQGISSRLSSKSYVDLGVAVALEAMIEFIGPQPALAKRLEQIYCELPAEAAQQLLHRMHSPIPVSGQLESPACENDVPGKISQSAARKPSTYFGAIKWKASQILGLLPSSASERLIRLTVRVLSYLGFKSKWKRQ